MAPTAACDWLPKNPKLDFHAREKPIGLDTDSSVIFTLEMYGFGKERPHWRPIFTRVKITLGSSRA